MKDFIEKQIIIVDKLRLTWLKCACDLLHIWITQQTFFRDIVMRTVLN